MYKKFNNSILATLFTLFLVRLALPQYVKYVLFPLVAVWFAYALWSWAKRGFAGFRVAIRHFGLPLALLLLYLLAYLVTPVRPDMLFRDLVNVGVFALFALSLVAVPLDRDDLKRVVLLFQGQAIVLSALISLAGIVKLYLQLKGVVLGFLKPPGMGYPQGTSLAADDNFFTLIAVSGIVFILPMLYQRVSRLRSVLLQLILLVLSASALMATSRRGLIISLSLFGFVLLNFLASVLVARRGLRNFIRNSWLFLSVMLVAFAGWYHLLFRVETIARNKWVALSGFNKYEVSSYVNYQVLSVRSIFKGSADYNEVTDLLWKTTFDPRYPYTGWAAGNYEVVDSLWGTHVPGLPSGALAARIGRGSHMGKWDGNAYYYSKILDADVEKGKRYLASLYCYVSPDFDGSWVRVSARGPVRGIRDWYYDFSQKGTWQKLQLPFTADSTNCKVYFYVCKQNDSTFNNLNGSVIFAYPELKPLDYSPQEPLTWATVQFIPVDTLPGNSTPGIPAGTRAMRPHKNYVSYRTKDSTWVFAANLFRYQGDEGFRMVPSLYAYVSPDFDGDLVYLRAGGRIYGFNRYSYNLKKKGTWQKLFLSFSIFEGVSSVEYGFRKRVDNPADSVKGYVLFAYPQQRELPFDANDPLTWAGTDFKRVYPLTGVNAERVPKGSVGLKIDSESQSWAHKDISYSSNPIKKIILQADSYRVKTSIYAYVSPDFSGTKVRLGASTENLWGYSALYYDLDKKGTWQKLTINNWGQAGKEFYSTAYFENPNSTDFSNLKGYVIWAHPTFRVMQHNPKDPETYTSSTFKREYPLEGSNAEIVPAGVAGARYTAGTEGSQWKDLHHSTTLYWGLPVEAGDSVFASVYCYVSPDFNGSDAKVELRGKVTGQPTGRYNLNAKGEWVLLQAKGMATEAGRVYGAYFFSMKGVTDFGTLKGHITFAYPQLVVKPGKVSALQPRTGSLYAGLLPLNQQEAQPDSLHDSFQLSMESDHFAGPRVDRWRYAWYLYRNEYSPLQKLVGGGFTYSIRFARKFHPNEPTRDYDYPHNPFLSVLLYSGVLGLILYVWFFVKSVYLYFRYRRDFGLVGITYLIAFFYSFFSSNSPFEPAILGILSLLPFVIDYVNRNEKP